MFLLRLAKDFGYPSPELMGEYMGSRQLEEWFLYYLDESSRQDPEPTEWDDEATLQRKMQRIAESKRKRR